jgi:peptide/nickel transport system permease protein
LAFLGLGDPHAMSWGYLANNAQRFLRLAWWMSLFPGVAIVVSVLGLNLLSDAVTDAHQPLTANVRPARSRRWRLRRRL